MTVIFSFISTTAMVLAVVSAQINPLSTCCVLNRRLVDKLDGDVASAEEESRTLIIDIGNVRSKFGIVSRQLDDIEKQIARNQREIDNLKELEERARERINNLGIETGAVGNSINSDRVDQSALLDRLEERIREDGLKFGRWLLKEGPCSNLFIKDTKRGGWYKLPKTCQCNNIYGEPVGEMLDVNHEVKTHLVPFCACHNFGTHGCEAYGPCGAPPHTHVCQQQQFTNHHQSTKFGGPSAEELACCPPPHGGFNPCGCCHCNLVSAAQGMYGQGAGSSYNSLPAQSNCACAGHPYSQYVPL